MDDDPSFRILVDDRQKTYRINTVAINDLLKHLLAQLELSQFELSVSFVESSEIREINRSFRHKDKSTDVLSFPQISFTRRPSHTEAGAFERDHQIDQSLGDIIVSLDNAHANASDIGHGVDREVVFLLIHGLLHLCGYDHIDDEDEEVMLKEQRSLLESVLNLPKNRALPLWHQCVEPRTGGQS